MARSRRYHVPGAVYHVMLRGNNGQAIFFEKGDLHKLWRLLEEGVERFDHRILAYCFMKNHIHLAVQAGQHSISHAIHNLSFRYAQFVNWKHERGGHLFQGRFKSILVDSRSYLLELVRYIHLNPVRAGIVESPEDFEWSSHLAYLGKAENPWLHTDYVLRRFDDERSRATAAYHRHLLEGVGLEPTVDFERGMSEGIIGDDDFIEQVLGGAVVESDVEVTVEVLFELISDHYDIGLHALSRPGKDRWLSRIRAILSYFVRETPGLSIRALSRLVRRSPGNLSNHARAVESSLGSDPQLKSELDQIRGKIAAYSGHHWGQALDSSI